MERRDPVVMTTLEVLKPPTTTFISDSPFDFTYYIALLAFKTQKYEKMTTTKIFSFSVLGLEQEHRQHRVLRSKYFTLRNLHIQKKELEVHQIDVTLGINQGAKIRRKEILF